MCVMVMLVFIVYCDVCDILRVVAYVLRVNLFTDVHHCSLCVAPTFSFEGIKNFLT